MSDIAIQVENLSKRYRIGRQEERPETLVGAALGWLKAPVDNFRQLRQLSRFQENGQEPDDIIWALKDVSFEVKRGEVVGIIGRNGAGKSTLLKILSRITEPTSGRVVLNGRVSSLLEVGTGFHPDLTGRENVYLNGAILGMTKREIDRKFDEIVDFSGVERFIDTPVKRYSSGMQVRLAFAVAAHLEPEILLVDEVLAVGDAAFQKKCLGKMGEVAKEGRTVLFVSHNMAAIQSFTQRSMLIEKGKIAFDGESQQCVAHYLNKTDAYRASVGASANTKNRIISFCQLLDKRGNPRTAFTIGETFIIRIGVRSDSRLSDPTIGIGINSSLGIRVTTMTTRFQNIKLPLYNHGIVVECKIDNLPLAPTFYGLKIAVGTPYGDIESTVIDHAFEIIPSDFWGSGKLPHLSQGVVLAKPIWRSFRLRI